MASVSPVVPVICSARTTPRTRRNHLSRSSKNVGSRKQKLSKNGGGLGNVVEVVQKDVEFIKAGFSKGLQWANRAFRVPEVSKKVEDLIWLRNVEDPNASFFQFPTWPQPYYPELSGVDLFMADLKALEVYAGYFYYLSKMWTKPLPETYDPEQVTEYFTLRPHIVALRLLEVFLAFVSATIKFRISRISSAADEDARENVSDYNFGIVLKETMLNLGPTFIKVGQSLSTRPDIIGYDISKALSELHDQIPPFGRVEAMKIIEEELGSQVETFFSHVSDEPVAAASFGQVYKASTHDGVDVAVKVQRPNLRHVVIRDIYILRIGLGLLQKVAKRKNDLRLYADELGKGFIGELDYNLEAANALEFTEAHSGYTFMSLPKVFRHLSKKRVLTMEWMVGDSPTDLISVSSQESKQKLLDMVNKGVEASLVQLLETGLMHADPHPGNLRYVSSGKIGFLDFGLLCRMEKKHQLAMLASIVHIVNGDWASLVHDLTEMDVIRPGTNIRRFTMDLEDALGDVEFNNGMPDVKFSRVLGKIWSLALKYHCRMPPYYVLVLRSLASLEGLAVAVDPTFKTFEAAYPYVVQKLLVDNSAATRRILHSVVFNRRREFQWHKLAAFLRVGATRKGLNSLVPSNTRTSLTQSTKEVAPEANLANLALRLLPSKNGLVLRRLLMTADGASLIRALVSNEASPFRQQLCKIIADILYNWMSQTLGKFLNLSPVMVSTGANEYEPILRDRRLRVILFKSLNSAKKDPVLLLRFCLSSFVLFFVASAMAFRRMLVFIAGAYSGRFSYNSEQIAVTA
ncbi:putative unusual protein kinase [Handroanthus impetiginosus]|uniref:Putative unusual protein kinase n=1 Tax=Handroanthus impetiginosus TaxID=429701 RepID=A0A2G9GQB6_9LAMI|nr:putative unusual protein kinase [Handroanthus impetiginosus]